MAYGRSWLDCLTDTQAIPGHKGVALLVKSPFFANTPEYYAFDSPQILQRLTNIPMTYKLAYDRMPRGKGPSADQLRWQHHRRWSESRGLEGVAMDRLRPKYGATHRAICGITRVITWVIPGPALYQ
jgi:hypothetical protein